MLGPLSAFVPRPACALACLAVLAVLAAPAAAAESITGVRIQNLGADQAEVPFTFGQVFAPGSLGKNDGLAARLGDGNMLPLQADVKATHPDGSVRHAIVSGILPKLKARATASLELVKAAAAKPARAGGAGIERLLADGLSASIDIRTEGAVYRATLADALAAAKGASRGANAGAWLDGAVAREWRGAVPLKSASGSAHPLLGASFAVRWYPGLEKQARVEVVVENTKTFQAGARNVEYDVEVEVGGRKVYQQAGLTHYRHARWRQLAWWNETRAPAIHVRPNGAYLIASGAVPNYDQTIKPDERALANLAERLKPDNTGPMRIGPVMAYMPTSGGRGDIGPLPSWSVHYLLSTDVRARDAMMAAAEGSGSWSVHLRDERTGYPVRTDTPANRDISTHMNLAHKGPLPVPRCAGKNLCKTPYTNDTAHQPSLAYLPYLLTGDYYYLEELQFWAATNPLGTDPANSGKGQGLVRWQQLRGQAWSLRTLGHAAYITPDAHPLKAYFTKQLDNNLAFYHATYVAGRPNKLGVYDGSGEGAFRVKNSAPWQDDFLTWSFGHLAELGFAKATPILRWKAAYPVGRMTAPGFCWTEGAAYFLKFRPDDKERGPLYDSFAELYRANYDRDSYRKDDGKRASHPDGARFIDQPCASQAQADWLTKVYRRTWTPGRMSGYADSPMGFPANMQPALAVAATSGIDNAAEAWKRFDARADKPDYARAPQWAIVPRR
ncbi:hypothetical protein ABIB38_000345 [Massilia sp. UYP11]|uniref:RIFT barrel domain-containing protein n=1 Tax=Massilia sp. UYP11 TaxID=1756385 RepID=UPI003D1E1433